MTAKPTDRRKRDLGRIHQLKARLGMLEPDYRAMLWTQARVKSAALLDAAGRTKVLTYLELLASPRRPPTAPKKRQLEPIERKVWALWYQLEGMGRIRKPASSQDRAKALRAFVKRMTGVDDLSFCSISQTMNLIESMKLWIERPNHLQDVNDDQ